MPSSVEGTFTQACQEGFKIVHLGMLTDSPPVSIATAAPWEGAEVRGSSKEALPFARGVHGCFGTYAERLRWWCRRKRRAPARRGTPPAQVQSSYNARGPIPHHGIRAFPLVAHLRRRLEVRGTLGDPERPDYLSLRKSSLERSHPSTSGSSRESTSRRDRGGR